ncbi:MAG TPA: alpha-L-arabinofuranosidase C-terminal domain-containing protein [Bacillota bacterium]|nr:alpha-L-arabinofuranosidase C-terminal domain-containing protein [Bacillota bacterium]
MNINIRKQIGHKINNRLIGLFFEDINYAADGGLYAEMIENRSFEFMKAYGEAGDYYVEYDGGYGWSVYPEGADVSLRFVTGSPLCEENPHYMRVTVKEARTGFANKAYSGIALECGKEYKVTFFARCVRFDGDFTVSVTKDGKTYAETTISSADFKSETYNFFRKYELTLKSNGDIRGGVFSITLSGEGIAEFDFISMFPADAVAGIFRRDLFELLRDIRPGFIRFPGGCIVEGNTLYNRYRYKDTLTEPWRRRNNWNRWAVHGTSPENNFETIFSHYNQTLGLGFYEYFLLCELIGAEPLPVLNVGLACQYQSLEQVEIESEEFKQFVSDAIDLIEFANGDVTTKWGAVRARLGHPAPFGLKMIGIGNEQWQTERADFFERYAIFEKAIHEYDKNILIIGSAGPDVFSNRYKMAWDFYRKHEDEAGFAYAVDEHYYVRPQWLYDHVDFYDNYSRKIKVFAGEYAAHPEGWRNTLEGALAEAAFLTGIERNSDVVILASYAPLFARVGYEQWAPDLIWFDEKTSYGSPSYYVQKLYATNLGDVTLLTNGEEKEAAKEGIYYSLSYKEESDTIIVKIVNRNDKEVTVGLNLDDAFGKKAHYTADILTHTDIHAENSIENPDNVKPYTVSGDIEKGITLPANSFAVVRL